MSGRGIIRLSDPGANGERAHASPSTAHWYVAKREGERETRGVCVNIPCVRTRPSAHVIYFAEVTAGAADLFIRVSSLHATTVAVAVGVAWKVAFSGWRPQGENIGFHAPYEK